MSQQVHQGIRKLLRAAHPEIRRLLLIAHRQHFKIRATANTHYLVGTPDREPNGSESESESGWTTVPRVPGGRHGIGNARAQLRRIGVQFEQQSQKGRRAA
jgi:hypothetical protein